MGVDYVSSPEKFDITKFSHVRWQRVAAVTSRSDKRQLHPGEAPRPPALPSLHGGAVGDYV